jgi:hypothetical protein
MFPYESVALKIFLGSPTNIAHVDKIIVAAVFSQ